MFWVFSFVACFKASDNLSKLVFLCPLFAREPNRHRGWGLYSAGTRLPKAMERFRLSEDVAVCKSVAPYKVVSYVFSIWWDLPQAYIFVWHSCSDNTVNSRGRSLRPETKYLQNSLQEKRLRSQKFLSSLFNCLFFATWGVGYKLLKSFAGNKNKFAVWNRLFIWITFGDLKISLFCDFWHSERYLK